jgi:hypothetical protein
MNRRCTNRLLGICSLKEGVMELINMLPGNISVNTVQHTTREEAVFSASGDVRQRWAVVL